MGRSRGQIILIAALGIAVTLVALALITNTAIYTENLATRETVNGQDAIAYENAVENSASGLLALANRYNASDHGTIYARFTADVVNVTNATTVESARYGHLVRTTVVDTTNGSRIAQNSSGSFTDDDRNESWTLATDVGQTRRFELNVSKSSLSSSSPFTVRVSNGTHEWTAEVSPGSDIDVTMSNETDSETCSATGSTTVVDLTEGTVNGSACDAPGFASDVTAPYNISFENASHAEGRYVLFVDETPSNISDGPYANATSPSTPTVDAAIYSATLDLSVRQSDLTYETNVTVAPEDSPEGEVYGVVP